MIQRIQTIFLFIASALMVAASLAPLSSITSPADVLTFYATHVLDARGASSTTTLQITLSVTMNLVALAGFATIFMYNNRKLQMLLCSLNIALVFLVCNLVVALSLKLLQSPEASISFKFAAVFPIVAFILFILAYRAIKKDEKLIRSLDRIR